MFGDDAKIASDVLGITLTARNHGKSGKIPLAGVPHHQAEKYLAGLLKAGYGVAVCDQIEDPKLAVGIVKRDVTEVLTPGSITVDGVIDEDTGSFIASVYIEDDTAGVALLDYTTGEFILDQTPLDRLELTFNRYQPSELLLPDNHHNPLAGTLKSNKIPSYRTEAFRYEKEFAESNLNRHFGTISLDGFGVSDMALAISAAGALLDYVKRLKKGQVDHLKTLKRASADKEMYLDAATIVNLELVESSIGGKEYSLLWLLDKCRTPMGKRLMRRRIIAPLIDKRRILNRQKKVIAFYNDRNLSDDIHDILADIKDLERMLSRFVAGRATPRDLLGMKSSFDSVVKLKRRLAESHDVFSELTDALDDFADILPVLEKGLVDNPPVSYLEGGIFKKGYSSELDDLRDGISDARQYIRSLQEKERKRTGIPTLKVGFNKVFGYYIEVTKPHVDKVPDEYIRKQTLVNAERFITEEMKVKEELILKAEEKINLLEAELFIKLKGTIKGMSARILTTSAAAARIDYFQSLAVSAKLNGYTLPKIYDKDDEKGRGGLIDIKAGRHPMVEKSLPPGEFIANDAVINSDDKRIQIITGPNMAGKSTYLRQVGLIVLMAQMGGFVPADTASISIADRVFTRVGAADKLAHGQSTFMVEMSETANIINNAMPQSLILLDELGRGTSTYDGLSLAWAITEHICENSKIASRTLFATHYHELTEMAELYEGINNLQVMVKEAGDKIVFLRKIKPGGCDDSYGIEVAKLAGLPMSIIKRADKILNQLEAKQPPDAVRRKIKKARPTEQSYQISLFSAQESKIAEKLRAFDIDTLTPLEALKILQGLKDEL